MEIFRHSPRWREQWTPIFHHKDSTIIKILSHLLYVPHSVFLCFSILDQIADLMSFHPYMRMSQHTALKILDISYITVMPFLYPIKESTVLVIITQPKSNLSKRHQKHTTQNAYKIYVWNLLVWLLSLWYQSSSPALVIFLSAYLQQLGQFSCEMWIFLLPVVSFNLFLSLPYFL